jgi:hypothetical protein
MEPTNKAPGIEKLLENFGGRTTAITSNRCTSCGKEVHSEDFKDQLSLKEYKISGMCQSCQNGFFES